MTSVPRFTSGCLRRLVEGPKLRLDVSNRVVPGTVLLAVWHHRVIVILAV